MYTVGVVAAIVGYITMSYVCGIILGIVFSIRFLSFSKRAMNSSAVSSSDSLNTFLIKSLILYKYNDVKFNPTHRCQYNYVCCF